MKISKPRQHHLKCGQQPDFKDKWFFCSADGETVVFKKDRKQHLESCKDCRDDPEKNGSNPPSTKEARKKKKHDPHVASNPVVDNLFNKNLMLKAPLRIPKELTKAERKEWNEADRERMELLHSGKQIPETLLRQLRRLVERKRITASPAVTPTEPSPDNRWIIGTVRSAGRVRGG